MKNRLKRLLAGFLAAWMLLTAVPAVKNDFSISASAVEYTAETAADETVVIAQEEDAAAEEEAEEPEDTEDSFDIGGVITAIINFFKDFASVIREAIKFLRKYGLIENKNA